MRKKLLLILALVPIVLFAGCTKQRDPVRDLTDLTQARKISANVKIGLTGGLFAVDDLFKTKFSMDKSGDPEILNAQTTMNLMFFKIDYVTYIEKFSNGTVMIYLGKYNPDSKEIVGTPRYYVGNSNELENTSESPLIEYAFLNSTYWFIDPSFIKELNFIEDQNDTLHYYVRTNVTDRELEKMGLFNFYTESSEEDSNKTYSLYIDLYYDPETKYDISKVRIYFESESEFLGSKYTEGGSIIVYNISNEYFEPEWIKALLSKAMKVENINELGKALFNSNLNSPLLS